MTETPAAVPLPPGVKGYVVACCASKENLTHTTPMDRETAENEAAVWRKTDRFGARYVVWELREADG
jgi:hypothetical protein